MQEASENALVKAYGVKKLNGQNYEPWSMIVKMVLEEKGLVEFIDGSAKKPEMLDVNGTVIYEEKKARTRRTLLFLLEEYILDMVSDFEEPKDVWNKLRDSYQPMTRLKRNQASRPD